MAQFFKASNSARNKAANKTSKKPKTLSITIDDIDQQGNGICLSTRPITIVSGALPSEQVRVEISHQSKKRQVGQIQQIEIASEKRLAPFCEVYEHCGGCSLQHLSAEDGLDYKQKALKSHFKKQAGLDESLWSAPLKSDIDYQGAKSPAGAAQSKATGYRRRVRLSIDARNTRDIKIGYRKAKSNEVIDIQSCPILSTPLASRLPQILPDIKQLKQVKALGHLQFTDLEHSVVLHLSFMNDVSVSRDEQISTQGAAEHSSQKYSALQALANKHQIRIIASYDSKPFFDSDADKTAMLMSDYEGIELALMPEHFIQVNRGLNQKMIEQCLDWMFGDEKAASFAKVHDFFCGLGNFSLPIAKYISNYGGKVSAYEGLETMVLQGRENAKRNQLSNIDFQTMDLADADALKHLCFSAGDAVLLDPSREGAQALCERLCENSFTNKAQRIVYVSCNANTLLRDLKILSAHYKVTRLGALDMFPFTQHLESIALLEAK